MKKIIIPEVEIEIGENLYLRLREVTFFPGDSGKFSGAPEDCYPPTDPEIDWKDENAMLIIRKVKYIKKGDIVEKDVKEYDYPVEAHFTGEYYDLLLDRAEEVLNEN